MSTAIRGYTTQTLIQLDGKVGVIVLTNTNDSNPTDTATQLMSTVGEAVAKATAVEPKVVAWVIRMITGDSYVDRVRD